MTASSGGRKNPSASTRLGTARPWSRAGSNVHPRTASRSKSPNGAKSWTASTAVTDPFSSSVTSKAAIPPDWAPIERPVPSPTRRAAA